jgi:hypothetical protein
MMKRGANKIGDDDYVACVKPSHKYVQGLSDRKSELRRVGEERRQHGQGDRNASAQPAGTMAMGRRTPRNAVPPRQKKDPDHLCQSWQLSATCCTWPYAMFWEVLWALILGFFLSAIVQAVVSKFEMKRLLPDDSLRSLAIATLLGGFFIVRIRGDRASAINLSQGR